MIRYNYGCVSALAYALLTASICTRMVTNSSYLSSFSSYDAFVVLEVLQICAAVLCFLACLSLPRRPVVEDGGTQIDGQYTGSAFNRYSFTWAGATLVLARKKKTLGLDDMPKLHVEGRSAYLQEYLKRFKDRDQLWKTIVFTHLPELLFQTVLSTFQSAAQFLPQLVMYQLLKRLESRARGNSTDKTIWGLVFALGLAMIVSSWSQNWLFWITWARLGQPIRTELSVMIFGKATRRKDVKSMQKSKQATNVDAANGTNIPTAFPESSDQKTTETHPVSGSSPGQAEEVKAEHALEEDIQKSRQSTINLVVRPAPLIKCIQNDLLLLLIGCRCKACLGLCHILLSVPSNIYHLSSQYSVFDRADRLEKLARRTVSVCDRFTLQHSCLKALQ